MAKVRFSARLMVDPRLETGQKSKVAEHFPQTPHCSWPHFPLIATPYWAQLLNTRTKTPTAGHTHTYTLRASHSCTPPAHARVWRKLNLKGPWLFFFPTREPRWNIYYAWQSCRPLTCYLINERKAEEQKKNSQQTTKVPKRDGETSQLSSVQGAPAACPKLIRSALLWSAGRWGWWGGGGGGKVMEGWWVENGIH